LFWIHYSHLGINPHGLKDQYADYWREHVHTAKIHYEYAKANPLGWENYGEKCWGLTASDDPYGYTAHQPMNNDNGTISPTAALASMPYVPEEALKTLRYFYRERGKDLFGKYGPYDAFNDNLNWVKKAYVGIDQGPIIIMLENYRTGLLWNNVMGDADVQSGLDKLGFLYRTASISSVQEKLVNFGMYPNPSTDQVNINLSGFQKTVYIKIYTIDGRLVLTQQLPDSVPVFSFSCTGLDNGFYIIQLTDGRNSGQAKLLIQKQL
jgi:hypothetical protein